MYTDGGAQTDLREMARLADELVHQIGATRREYQELKVALDGAEAAPGEDGEAAGAHLVALSIALAGGSVEEARGRLRDDMGIERPDAIVDEAFEVQVDGLVPEAPPRRRRFARAAATRTR
jgi:hypothetical protein